MRLLHILNSDSFNNDLKELDYNDSIIMNLFISILFEIDGYDFKRDCDGFDCYESYSEIMFGLSLSLDCVYRRLSFRASKIIHNHISDCLDYVLETKRTENIEYI